MLNNFPHVDTTWSICDWAGVCRCQSEGVFTFSLSSSATSHSKPQPSLELECLVFNSPIRENSFLLSISPNASIKSPYNFLHLKKHKAMLLVLCLTFHISTNLEMPSFCPLKSRSSELTKRVFEDHTKWFIIFRNFIQFPKVSKIQGSEFWKHCTS